MKLLFVCTHNACRSILAEAITRQLAGDRIEVASAGSAATGKLHPLTLEHLSKAGIPAQGLASSTFEEVAGFEPDAVVTVCDSAANEPCPLWLGPAIKSHWGLPDPSHLAGTDAERDAAFDAIMSTLGRRILFLLEQSPEDLEGPALKINLDKAAEIH